MAYPVGVVGVVLFVQLLPKLLKVNMVSLGEDLQRRLEAQESDRPIPGSHFQPGSVWQEAARIAVV